MKEKESILQAIGNREMWDEFLEYKTKRQHLSKTEQKILSEYIENKKCRKEILRW